MVTALPKVKEEPFKAAAPVLLPAVNKLPEPEARVVVAVEERAVKAAVPGVVTPMLVELIPVE